MTDKTHDEGNTLDRVRELSDALLKSGFVTLRAMPGHEKEASGGERALASYVQILEAPNTPGYLVRVIPKNALWTNHVVVSFVPNGNKTRVAVKASGISIPLGDDPNFKILLNQVVQSMAEVLKAS